MSEPKHTESDIRARLTRISAAERFSCHDELATILDSIRSDIVRFDTIVDFLCACFRDLDMENIRGTLIHLFPGLVDMAVNISDAVPSPHLLGIRKTEGLLLVFPHQMALAPALRVKVLWLIWFLPQLEHAIKLDPRARGFTYMSQWDVGVWNGLAYSSASPDHLLIPDNVFIPSRGYRDFKKRLGQSFVPWGERVPICFWRGGTTGQTPAGSIWSALPRIQFVTRFKGSASFDVGLSKISQIDEEAARNEIKQAGLLRDYVPSHLQQKWKYLVDIDGNSNAWSGLFEKLLSGSVVLKISSFHNYKQWYYHNLIPWEHYVPVAPDFSDLESKVRLLERKDKVARQIGEAGRCLAESLTYESQLEIGALTIIRAMRIFEEK